MTLTADALISETLAEFGVETISASTPITGDGAVTWIQREFYIPETNAPIHLLPYQQQVIREALRTDADGSFIYSTVLYSDLKKSAKSTISAAVALYMAWHRPYETVRIVGNDLKQADSRTFYYIKRAIELNPSLRQQCHIKQYEIRLPNATTIHAIPVDPKGEAGGGDLIITFTELWAMKNEASKQLWSETTLSPLKYGKSLRWCESYAGFNGESPILEQLYEQGVKSGRRVDGDLELYVNDRLLAFWNTRPRCPWQTTDYYAQEAQILAPSEFERLHRNKWADASHPFVPLEWWNACKWQPGQDAAEFPPYKSIVLGMDAAVSGDYFAVVGVSRQDGMTYVRYVRVWQPVNGKIDYADVETEVLRLVSKYNIECVTYDPYQMEHMAQRLSATGKVYVEPFNQGAPRSVADKALYDKIRQRRLIHSGDATLDEAVRNANAEQARGFRIVKRAEHLKIDPVVALSMAAQIADDLEI